MLNNLFRCLFVNSSSHFSFAFGDVHILCQHSAIRKVSATRMTFSPPSWSAGPNTPSPLQPPVNQLSLNQDQAQHPHVLDTLFNFNKRLLVTSSITPSCQIMHAHVHLSHVKYSPPPPAPNIYQTQDKIQGKVDEVPSLSNLPTSSSSLNKPQPNGIISGSIQCFTLKSYNWT